MFRLCFFWSLCFYRGSLLVLTTSLCILESRCRSALITFCGGCCSSPVGRELYKEILYSWCKFKFSGSHCFWELHVHLERQCFLLKICQVKKKCTYFVCNLENDLFQVLSSTVSTQAMQRPTAGQGATRIRPPGKVPHKYFKWRKK